LHKAGGLLSRQTLDRSRLRIGNRPQARVASSIPNPLRPFVGIQLSLILGQLHLQHQGADLILLLLPIVLRELADAGADGC